MAETGNSENNVFKFPSAQAFYDKRMKEIKEREELLEFLVREAASRDSLLWSIHKTIVKVSRPFSEAEQNILKEIENFYIVRQPANPPANPQ